ncbi:hypothetical protein [Gymnodinialimonas sp.]
MTISLTLTLDEVNQVLDALGTKPYLEVFELVEKIRRQASEDLTSAGPDSGSDP